MAVKTRAELKSENAADFPDNVARLISPAGLRGQMDDIVDSMLMDEDDVSGPPGPEGPPGPSGSDFIHEGSDAVSRPVQDRLRDTVHLLDYIPVAEHAAIAAGTSTYDCLPAFEAIFEEFGHSITVPPGTALNDAGPDVLLPRGLINISAPIEIKRGCCIRGSGGGYSPDVGYPTIIQVAADQHGIIVHSYNTYGQGLASDADDWASGATYTASEVIVASPYGIYECSAAGGGTSTVRPTHATGAVTGADGYSWEYVASAGRGDGTELRNFSLQSLGGTSGHGIWMRARATCYDINIKRFPQDGYHIVASATPAALGEFQGNANNWRVYNGRVTSCGGNGMFIDGADANAGTAIGVDCSSNDGWGFWDDSFLGNGFYGCHTNGNGVESIRQYDSNVYRCVSQALAPTTTPGTDGDIWFQTNTTTIGGTVPPTVAWVSGTTYVAGAVGTGSLVLAANHVTYRCTIAGGGTSTNQPTHTGETAIAYADGYSWINAHGSLPWVSGDTTVVEGGCFKTEGASQIPTLINCYAEAGQPAVLSQGTFCLYPGFGANNLTPSSSGTHWDQTGINALKVIRADASGDEDWSLLFGAETNNTDFIWTFQHDLSPSSLRETLDRTNGALALQYANTSATRTFLKTLFGTTYDFGRSAAVPHAFYVDKLFVGSSAGGAGAVTTARQITSGTAIPTSGNWAAGDIVFNGAPLLGEPFAWRCILAGTPGTWQPLRDQGSQQTIATDAVFTLTPGTSPYRTLHTGTLTANRQVTLSTTGALIGLSYRITRTGGGAFDLNVGTGPLKALATNTWCEVAFDGTAWYLSAYGTL